MTPSELKSAALSLLNGGSAWCQGASARDANGLPCSPRSPNAVEWDLMGAIIKAFEGETDYTSYHQVLKDLTDGIPSSHKNRDIESWNDSATWADINGSVTQTPLKMQAATGETLSSINLE